MDKAAIVSEIRDLLKEQHARIDRAFQESKAYSNDPDSKAESKYDTRSLEASYLAAGQAEELAKAEAALATFTDLELPAYDCTTPVGAGALVEVDHKGELRYLLLAPAGGGLVTEYLGCELQVLTPDAPLYQQLLGRQAGDADDEESGISILDLV